MVCEFNQVQTAELLNDLNQSGLVETICYATESIYHLKLDFSFQQWTGVLHETGQHRNTRCVWFDSFHSTVDQTLKSAVLRETRHPSKSTKHSVHYTKTAGRRDDDISLALSGVCISLLFHHERCLSYLKLFCSINRLPYSLYTKLIFYTTSNMQCFFLTKRFIFRWLFFPVQCVYVGLCLPLF